MRLVAYEFYKVLRLSNVGKRRKVRNIYRLNVLKKELQEFEEVHF